MSNLEELKVILRELKDAIKNEYGVTEIGLFGSCLKGEPGKNSDIDILVDFQRSIDLLTFVHLKNYLSGVLGLRVDLVMKKALKPKIGERILKEIVYV